ncbi:unnamed protein product [Amoebophrya sp. A25]|nr:unnamed protein product [Amoebophrya sp. A25]|eukprot:GSA25T00003347001.1
MSGSEGQPSNMPTKEEMVESLRRDFPPRWAMKAIKHDPRFTVVREVPMLLSPEGVVELLEKIGNDRNLGALMLGNAVAGQQDGDRRLIVNFTRNATAMDQALVLEWCSSEIAQEMHGTHRLTLKNGGSVLVDVFQYKGQKCYCCAMVR